MIAISLGVFFIYLNYAERTERQRHKTILKTIAVFVVSYTGFLILWIQIKDYYGYGVAYTGARLVMFVKDVNIEETRRPQRDTIEVTFSPLRDYNMLIDLPVRTSSYTFNAPLTFAIMATLFPFLRRRRRAYLEALLILLSVHLLYVFSLYAEGLTNILIERRLEKQGLHRVILYQFLWQFTDNMVIRFEPFLIGFYMFIRFRL